MFRLLTEMETLFSVFTSSFLYQKEKSLCIFTSSSASANFTFLRFKVMLVACEYVDSACTQNRDKRQKTIVSLITFTIFLYRFL